MTRIFVPRTFRTMTFRPRTPPPPLERWATLRFAALFALQPLLGLLRLVFDDSGGRDLQNR